MQTPSDGLFQNEASGLALVLLDGKDGPALRISDPEARALVARVIERSRKSPPRTRSRRRRMLPFMLGAVMATSAAAAYQRSWPMPWFHAAEPEQANGASSAPRPARSVAAPAAQAVRSTPAAPEHASPPAPELAPEPVAVPAPRRDTPRATPAIAVRKQPASDAMAEDGLSRANTLRGQRRWADALAAYLAVVERHPRSRQAQAARVAAAALELERFGNAADAERLYAAAAERGPELAAEARFGIAESHRARGDARREREALRTFLQRHPESPLVAAARRRLQSLDRQ